MPKKKKTERKSVKNGKEPRLSDAQILEHIKKEFGFPNDTELSRASGIARSKVAGITGGDRTLSDGDVVKLYKELGVSIYFSTEGRFPVKTRDIMESINIPSLIKLLKAKPEAISILKRFLESDPDGQRHIDFVSRKTEKIRNLSERSE